MMDHCPHRKRMEGLTLFLKPSVAQTAALDRLLIDLQDPGSRRYHQWRTPEEYAAQFGVSASDAAVVAAWLESQGFHVGQIARSRTWIVFDGQASTVEGSFHPRLHRYRSATALHYANAVNPTIPAALEPLVRSIGGLDDFIPESPDLTTSSGGHQLAPGDLATIYDTTPLLSAGIDGTGQKLVVIGQSAFSMSYIQMYRSQFGLSAPNIQILLVPNFPDPGTVPASILEAEVDLELAGAVAPNAAIQYVFSGSALNVVTYAVDQNLAPVISSSYSTGCDASVPAAQESTYQSLARQANAQGITWIASSGDFAAAGCDSRTEQLASQGLATRFPSDIPEVTAVGGTQFNDQSGSYWASTNSANGGSARSYIPEVVWNETSSTTIAGSTGGASAFFAKPPWQTGPGVPNDGQRDVPDVALAAAAHHDSYFVVSSTGATGAGGSSTAAPSFAAMMVLLNQYLVKNGVQAQPGLGNLNALLYRLAQSNPSAFHDITSGNNNVNCVVGSPNCSNGTLGYSAGPGYDLCTGLGSIDLAQPSRRVARHSARQFLHRDFEQRQSHLPDFARCRR